MFHFACDKFASSVGPDTLHPAPSIDEKDKIKLQQLVVKTIKRQYFFSIKNTYAPTSFQIKDVLEDNGVELALDQQTEELVGYSETSEITLKGAYGLGISKDCGFGVKLDDAITIVTDFGIVEKNTVSITELIHKLDGRKINMSHNCIKPMQENQQVLCVITGVLCLKDSGKVHSASNKDANAAVSGVAEAEVRFHKGKKLRLVAGTPVAYSVHELNVDSDSGSIVVVDGKDETGGFKTKVDHKTITGTQELMPRPVHASSGPTEFSTDSTDDNMDILRNDIDFQRPKTLFEPLLKQNEERRTEAAKDILKILESPCDIQTLANLLQKCEAKQYSPYGEELNLRTPTKIVKTVLVRAGLNVKGDKVFQPKLDNDILPCLAELFDAAAELDEVVVLLISRCKQKVIEPLTTVLEKGMEGIDVTDIKLIEQFTNDPKESHVRLLDVLGFECKRKAIKVPKELPHHIDVIYWVLTALC